MISRQEHHEALRKAHRQRILIIRDKYLEDVPRRYVDHKPVQKPLSEKDRITIRNSIKTDFLELRRRNIVAFVLILIVLGCICFWILNRM